MAAGIVNAICTFVAANAYNGAGCTVWDGEVHRYDEGGQSVSPEASGGRKNWPAIKITAPDKFHREWTFEEPYYDEGLIVVQIFHHTRAGAEGAMDMIEALLVSAANWTAIGALIPSPYYENSHYVVQLLLIDWVSKQVEGERTQKQQLLYTCELYFKTTIHGAIPVA